VVVGGQEVSGSDDHGYRPVDEFERGQGGNSAVVRELFWPRNLDLTQQREVDYKGFAFADFLHGLGLGRCLTSFLFRHHLPFSNEGFPTASGRAANVGLARVPSVPLAELYALLWRVGVVRIAAADPKTPQKAA
jgi:hypothetical protein